MRTAFLKMRLSKSSDSEGKGREGKILPDRNPGLKHALPSPRSPENGWRGRCNHLPSAFHAQGGCRDRKESPGPPPAGLVWSFTEEEIPHTFFHKVIKIYPITTQDTCA